MISSVDVGSLPSLDSYARIAQLTHAVQDLRSEAEMLVPRLRGRRVWMINSTAQGGGVAEMLPRLVTLLTELGADTRWVVMNTEHSDFFVLTKKIHNLIHGSGSAGFSPQERELYDRVSREIADELGPMLSPGDVLVVHDPQPAGAGAILARERKISTIWRCHIGLDDDVPQTRAAWKFLEPYVSQFDHCVFTAPEYIPTYLTGRVSIIYPALDPYSHKNRELSTHKLVGILCNSALIAGSHPTVTEPFDTPVLRLQPDGRFLPANQPEDLGLLYRPIVTQISRWDELKGWEPLLKGFAALKRRSNNANRGPREQRALELVRLVLAGPETAAVKDDPEALGVLERLSSIYRSLDPKVQRDVAMLSLPMSSRKNNALMVNVLQRCSSIVVQNSLREGFGLTVAEAMWKRVAVLGTNACGIRQQIRHGIDGYLNPTPDDPEAIAGILEMLLVEPRTRMTYAQHAQRRVYESFLVFAQAARWLRVLSETIEPPRYSVPPVA